MKTLILNIKQLVQTELSPRKWVAGKDMARLGILENAYLLVEEDKIAGFGKTGQTTDAYPHAWFQVRFQSVERSGRKIVDHRCPSAEKSVDGSSESRF